MRRRDVLTAVSGLALGLALAVAPASAEVSFAGKTLNVIMSVPAGSGGDIAGRMFTRHMAKHLPGNPNVVAQNRPGGAGAVALNYVYENAPKDGTTIYYGAWNAPAVIEGREGVRYVPENMGIIGAAAGFPSLVIRKDRISDANELATAEKFIVGGRGATRTIELLGNMALKMLGADFRYVGGFGGFSKIQAAIKANEVHAGHAGLAGYTKFFGPDSDVGFVAYYHVAFDEAGNPVEPAPGTYPDGTPSVLDVHQAIHGKAPSGPIWDAYRWHRSNIMSADQAVLAPPGLADDVVETLRAAYQKTAADPEFLNEYREVIGAPQRYNSTEFTLQIFNNYRTPPAAVKATLEEMGSL